MRKHNKRFAAVMALTLALTMVFSSVSVNAATKKVKSMTLSAKNVTLEINDTKKVTVKKVTPAKASKKVTWKSSNKNVATVSAAGVITAKAEGKATITATSKSNKKVKKTVKVTVKPFEQHYVNAETVYNVLGSEVVLDVRPAEKYAAGHVPGAVAASVKDGDVEATFNAVVKKYGKNTKYYLVCNSGNTLADLATTELQKRGVATSKIFTLGGDDAKKSPEGGWVAWTKHYPDFVVAPGKTAKGFEFNHIITKEVLKKELAKGEASKVTVIDVRDAEAYANGHIPGAISAPLKDEKGDLDDAAAKAVISKVVKANPNKLYAVCCYTGNKYANRAKEVMTLLGMDENKHLCIDGGYGKWSETEDVLIGNDGLVYNKGTKTVTFDCKVTDKRNAKPAHWFIVNENGSMAGKTLLTTKVTTDDFYNAIEAVAGKKVWNDVAGNEFGADESIDDQLNKSVGSKDFAKFDLTVSWGGKTFPLSKVVTKPTYKGEAYKGSYDIAFAGNLDNQHKAKTGCITCFGGCYMGITSGHDTPMMIEYTPANLPKAGKTVTVTYTVK